MSSRNTRRERSLSRSPERSRSRSKHYRTEHDRRNTRQSHYHKDSSSRARNTLPNDRNKSKSRSYPYSNSPSRSRSRSRSRTSDGTNTQNCRENAELPSDHPLFSIVTKQRQNQMQSNTPSPSPSPKHNQHNDQQQSSDHQRPSQRTESTSNHPRSTDRDRNRSYHNEHRDWNNKPHHRDYRDRGNKEYRRRTRDRVYEANNNHVNGNKYQDASNIHSRFELNFHTGHKQQVLAKKKQEIAPQITATQAQQIIAVTTIVQKQEEITEIVETQKRKLKRQTSLERIKEKILLQKQQMMARKKNISSADSCCADNVFGADLVIPPKSLPNMSSMMHSGSNSGINVTQRQAIENLAAFVKKHGNALEQTVRDRSKDDPKFSWLYDVSSNGYQYYQLLLQEKKKRKRRRFSAHPEQQSMISNNTAADKALDKMNAYINKLEDQEKEKRDERYERANQMSIFNGGGSHHIGDYLPENEVNKFNSAKGKELNKLTHKNRGHAMLKRLGWSEGTGLGRNEDGIIKPISSIITKKENNAGIGGNNKPWDPTPGDDQFDLYKKKMMLSYRYRPNPLGNPRKDYY